MDCLRRLGGIEGGAGQATQLMNRKEGYREGLKMKSHFFTIRMDSF